MNLTSGAMGQPEAFFGVYPGLVTDVRDPENLGRVRIRLAGVVDPDGSAYEAWARLATLMGGAQRGTWFVPDVHDEVLLAFQSGDPRQPFVLGSLWNGSDRPPGSMDEAGQNNLKIIRSRNGVKVTMDDRQGQESLVIETPGQQVVTLKDGPGSIELRDSNGNSIRMEAAGITFETTGRLSINAGAGVQVSTGIVTVSAGMADFSGVVKSATSITNTIISSVYTPGAGNIW